MQNPKPSISHSTTTEKEANMEKSFNFLLCINIFLISRSTIHFCFRIQIYCSFGCRKKILHEGKFDFYYNLILFLLIFHFFPSTFIFFHFLFSSQSMRLIYIMIHIKRNFFITEDIKKSKEKDPSINFILHFLKQQKKKRKVSIKI